MAEKKEIITLLLLKVDAMRMEFPSPPLPPPWYHGILEPSYLRIMQSCRDQGLPEPRIEIVPNFVNLTIWFKDLVSAQDSSRLHKTAQDTTTKPTDVSPVERILQFCHTPKSITEIAKLLGVSDKKWVRARYVTPLIGNGLKLTMPDKPNSRMQKYVTDMGEE